MAIRRRTINNKLVNKFGFEEAHGRSHDKYKLVVDGQVIARTVLSRGHREIQNDILNRIARSCFVNLSYLREMIQCTKSREEYLTKLKSDKQI